MNGKEERKDERYHGADRRNPTNHTVVVQMLADLSGQVATLSERLTKHMDDEENRDKWLRAAFPNDDPKGHREYHDSLLDASKAKKEFWTKMTFELLKWGVIGFIGWMVLQLWQAFLRGPQ